jgi:hypothetical protein
MIMKFEPIPKDAEYVLHFSPLDKTLYKAKIRSINITENGGTIIDVVDVYDGKRKVLEDTNHMIYIDDVSTYKHFYDIGIIDLNFDGIEVLQDPYPEIFL